MESRTSCFVACDSIRISDSEVEYLLRTQAFLWSCARTWNEHRVAGYCCRIIRWQWNTFCGHSSCFIGNGNGDGLMLLYLTSQVIMVSFKRLSKAHASLEVWGLFCDFGCWMMNDLDEYKVVSDQSLVNNEPRYKNCALCFANTNCPRDDNRTVCSGTKWGPMRLHMRSKWASWGTVNVFLRPTPRLDVAKVVPRSIAPVPIKHFGVHLGHIFQDFGD